MTLDSKVITRTIRNAIARTAREYFVRSNNRQDYLGIPEYLHNVRIYDALWSKLDAKNAISSTQDRVCITLEEPAADVKWYTEKRGPTDKVVSGSKRHDVCVWIVDRPICVIEVKLFGNRYGVFNNDVKRLEAVVRGKHAPDFSVLAFHGFWPYDGATSKKHQVEIEERFHKHDVEIRAFQFQGFEDRFLAGTITVSK